MATLQSRYRAALEKLGCKVVPYNSGRYLVLARPLSGYYFLGDAGALRVGQTVTSSIPVADSFKARLLRLDDTVTTVQPAEPVRPYTPKVARSNGRVVLTVEPLEPADFVGFPFVEGQ